MSLLLAAFLSLQPAPAPAPAQAPVDASVPEATPDSRPAEPAETRAEPPGVGPGVASTPTPVAAPVSEPAPDPTLGPGVASTPAAVSTPTPAPIVKPRPIPTGKRERDGRGLLIAGGVLVTLADAYRIGVEAFWLTRDELPPGGAFGRWSVPTIVLTTNLGNVPLLVPGVTMLVVGMARRGRADGQLDRAAGVLRQDIPRLRKTGIGLLTGGLVVWGFGRALFLSWIDLCPTNACVYGLLETTFWAGGGMALAGGMLTAYTRGYRRTAGLADLRVLPMATPQMSGLALSGRF